MINPSRHKRPTQGACSIRTCIASSLLVRRSHCASRPQHQPSSTATFNRWNFTSWTPLPAPKLTRRMITRRDKTLTGRPTIDVRTEVVANFLQNELDFGFGWCRIISNVARVICCTYSQYRLNARQAYQQTNESVSTRKIYKAFQHTTSLSAILVTPDL